MPPVGRRVQLTNYPLSATVSQIPWARRGLRAPGWPISVMAPFLPGGSIPAVAHQRLGQLLVGYAQRMDYDTVDAQVRELSDSLQGADHATVAAEVSRLKGLAAKIPDALWRARALARVDRLPELISGPAAGASAQFERAAGLVGDVMGAQGSPEERIAAAERAIREIADLAEQAPAEESGTILRMNSSLARLIEELRIDGRQR